jgi:isopenicillin N synthase-like dioxygenase
VIPVVDLSGDPAGVSTVIDDACHRVGFFQIVGHGLDADVEAAAWEAARAFFRLPVDDKLTVSIPPGDAYGYGPYGVERLAASLGEATPPDLKETFSVGPDDATCDAGAAADPAAAFVFSRTPWPVSLPGLEIALRAYYDALAALVGRLMGLMALGLGLDRDHFVPYIDRHTSALRALHYPDLAGVEPEPGQLRAGAHSDYGTLTLLRQSGPGLQVIGPGGEWVDVPVVDGAYVVNIGDALERWTNDRWRSTVHRVVMPRSVPRDGAGGDRQSMAFFHNANWDAVVECLPTCLVPGRRPRHEPITAGRHLMDKFRSTQS